jgi:hypothetical protein
MAEVQAYWSRVQAYLATVQVYWQQHNSIQEGQNDSRPQWFMFAGKQKANATQMAVVQAYWSTLQAYLATVQVYKQQPVRVYMQHQYRCQAEYSDSRQHSLRPADNRQSQTAMLQAYCTVVQACLSLVQVYSQRSNMGS